MEQGVEMYINFLVQLFAQTFAMELFFSTYDKSSHNSDTSISFIFITTWSAFVHSISAT